MSRIFGQRLKELRIEKGLTQEELAMRVGTSKPVISRYESMERTPKVTMAFRLSEALDVGLPYLLGETDDRTLKKLNEPTLTATPAPPIPGFDELTEENKKIVEQYIDFLLSKQ